MKNLFKTGIRLVAAGLLAALLVGCAAKGVEKAREQGGRELKTKQLRELVAGRTLHLNQYGETADLELQPDGTLKAVNYAGEKDSGKWKVEDDKLCIVFERWNHGDQNCYTVFQMGEEYQQFSANGTLAGTFRVSGEADVPADATDRQETVSQPIIQEEPAPPAGAPPLLTAPDPNAKQDLRFIYREMAQDCPGCDLTGISLVDATLRGANLAGADLSGSDFSRATLRRANLRGAKLVGTDFSQADLGGADLQGADLSRANLTGANLAQANLKGAILDGVVGADLQGALQ